VWPISDQVKSLFEEILAPPPLTPLPRPVSSEQVFPGGLSNPISTKPIEPQVPPPPPSLAVLLRKHIEHDADISKRIERVEKAVLDIRARMDQITKTSITKGESSRLLSQSLTK
jgi:hypothetical protein